jgi:hypothetical protein
MRKFRFYITNAHSGAIEGTDDEELAVQAAKCEDFWVIDTNTGYWLIDGGAQVPEEFKLS